MWSEVAFWRQRFCPHHIHDGTPRCASCERLRPHAQADTWAELEDGRQVCLPCLGTITTDTRDAQPLWHNVLRWACGAAVGPALTAGPQSAPTCPNLPQPAPACQAGIDPCPRASWLTALLWARPCRSFYVGMGMPLPVVPPMMLVDSGALNEAEGQETRGKGRGAGPVFHVRGGLGLGWAGLGSWMAGCRHASTSPYAS